MKDEPLVTGGGGAGALGDVDSALNTFPKLLIHNADIFADRIAVRHKDLGIWRTWTWPQVLENVREFSIGLGLLGLKRGDKLAVVGSNRPRLYWAMCAAQALGAVPVPVYADAVADEMAFVLDHAEVTIAVAEDQEQVDKILSVAERLPRLKTIVYDEPRGLRDYDRERLIFIDDVQTRGREALANDPHAASRWERSVAAGKGSELAIILYTSGTTGRSKGVMLTNDNVLISARNGNAFDHLGPDEEIIAYLPIAWVGDHIFSYAQAYIGRFLRQLPGSPGDRGRGPPRDRHHLRLRPAAHLREPA